MQRVFSIDVLLCDTCGRRMKPIEEVTDKRVARKMLEHFGFPSDAPEPWVESAPWFDDEPRAVTVKVVAAHHG
jgi:hypothetical protein